MPHCSTYFLDLVIKGKNHLVRFCYNVTIFFIMIFFCVICGYFCLWNMLLQPTIHTNHYMIQILYLRITRNKFEYQRWSIYLLYVRFLSRNGQINQTVERKQFWSIIFSTVFLKRSNNVFANQCTLILDNYVKNNL